jgi:phasin family protein
MSEIFTPPTFSVTGQALAKANVVAGRGFQELAQYFLDCGRQSFENAVEMNKRLASVKTFAELGEVQAKLAQKSFEVAIERGRVLSEVTREIARDLTASFSIAATTTSGAMRKAENKKSA